MNWANGFSFGNMPTTQRDIFEDKPDLAYQQLTDWFGGGAAAFPNTVFGRFLSQQQQPLYNRFLAQQAANPTGNLTWTNYLEGQSGGIYDQFKSLPQYMRGVNPGAFRVRRELW